MQVWQVQCKNTVTYIHSGQRFRNLNTKIRNLRMVIYKELGF